MSKEAQEGVKMQYSFTEILREEGPNLEQKNKEGESNDVFVFPVVWMIKKKRNGRTEMGVKKVFQIIVVCLFKSCAVRVHEISAHFCDLFQHCFVFVLCSQWQCHAHSCVTEGSAHFVLSVFLCSMLFASHSSLCPLLFSSYMCLYITVSG